MKFCFVLEAVRNSCTATVRVLAHDVTIDQLSINSSPSSVFSDHFIISFFSVNSCSYANKSKPGYVFDFSKANFGLISDFLLESDFSIVFEYNDLEFIWFLLNSLIFEAINLFVPKIFVRDSQDPKWFNSEVRNAFVL